jgi:AraC-like DNA-binding protein
MDERPDSVQETVFCEPGTLFRFRHDFGTENHPRHWHNEAEILMPIHGAYLVNANHRTYRLNERDILILPPGESHEVKSLSADCQHILLQFKVELLSVMRGFIHSYYTFWNLCAITPENNPELHQSVEHLLLGMLEEFLARKIHYNIAITTKIIEIALHLTRRKQLKDDSQHKIRFKRKEHVERLSECIGYINQHFDKDLTLENVAQAVGFSKFYFSRWFHETANQSFNDYLTKIRMDKAETLLLGTSRPITEIAIEVGFQSVCTFNRLFRKHRHCTPTEYRDIHALATRPKREYAGASAGARNLGGEWVFAER